MQRRQQRGQQDQADPERLGLSCKQRGWPIAVPSRWLVHTLAHSEKIAESSVQMPRRSSSNMKVADRQMWYVAQLVERIRVQGDPRSVVHVNYVLVRAKNPSQGYGKAKRLGESGETSYANPSGQRVTSRFLGIRELNEVYEELEDGAEILYTQHVGLSDRAARALVPKRTALSVFRRRSAAEDGPDFTSGEIVQEALRRVSASRARKGQRRSRRGTT
jgi:hypothetical protein